MLRVCICDDNVKDLKLMEELAKDFALLHADSPFTLHKFSSPYVLLENIEENGGFDIYILDIIMPNIDGVKLAKKIRARNEACEIIYLTSSREYAVDAFGVGALNYLLKPINNVDFNKSMTIAFERLSPLQNSCFMFKTKNGVRKIKISDIVFIESFNHYRVIKLVSGEDIRTEKTITSLKEELKELPNFQLSHRAYLVNLDYVTGIMDKSIMLTVGNNIPLARNNLNAFKNAYIKYTV